MDFIFFFNSILIGIGLAMDAFSASLANGLNEPCMPRRKMCGVAAIFALFQGAMPLLGWFCVHTAAEKFALFEKAIPWIALALLGFIGTKMLIEGVKDCREHDKTAALDACGIRRLGFATLLVQGIATSIDALSVGFTISDYNFYEALVSVLLIAAVTFVICFVGIILGKRFGVALAGKSSIFGGAILIFIGLEIFITSFI